MLFRSPLTQKTELLGEFPNQNNRFQVLIIGVGSMAWTGFEAAENLNEKGISCAALNLRFVKPLDEEYLLSYLNRSDHVIVVEEGSETGGVFSYILSTLGRRSTLPLHNWHCIGIPDRFIDHGKMESLRKHLNLLLPIYNSCHRLWLLLRLIALREKSLMLCSALGRHGVDMKRSI